MSSSIEFSVCLEQFSPHIESPQFPLVINICCHTVCRSCVAQMLAIQKGPMQRIEDVLLRCPICRKQFNPYDIQKESFGFRNSIIELLQKDNDIKQLNYRKNIRTNNKKLFKK